MSSAARSAAPPAKPRVGSTVALRLAILSTALAVVLGLTLLIEETPYVFTAFMILGPALLAIGFLLLGIVIFRELRSREVV